MKGLFTENLGLKIVAVTLAVLLEIYLYSPDNSVEAVQTATVEVSKLPEGLAIVSPPNLGKGFLVTFQVKGPKQIIQQVKAGSYRAVVELPPNLGDSYVAHINEELLGLPSGVEVLEIEPSSLVLKFEPLVTKELLVSVDLLGEPALGYRLQTPSSVPFKITARGPKSELDGLSVVQTERISIEGITESRQEEVKLLPKGPLTVFDTRTVRVDVRVVAIPSEKIFSKVKVQLLTADGVAAAVEPTVVEATISGPAALVDNLRSADLEVVADATPFTSGKHEVTLTARLPDGVSLTSTTPRAVVVTLQGGRS